MNIQYKFYIEFNKGGNKIEVHPIYKDDLLIRYARETDEIFFRAKLGGSLTFVRDDYERIMNTSFNTECFLHVEKSADGGKTFSEYWVGKFMRTDCKVDVDNRTVEVEPDVYDRYSKILAGLEKEYNILKESMKMYPVTIKIRPELQIYVPGDEILTCYVDGSYWEESVNEITTNINTLQDTYKFGVMSTFLELSIQLRDGAPEEYGGTYSGKLEARQPTASNPVKSIGEFTNEHGAVMEVREIQEYDEENPLMPTGTYWIYRIDSITNPGTMVYYTNGSVTSMIAGDPTQNEQAVLQAFNGAPGYLVSDNTCIRIMGRSLVGVEEIEGQPTAVLPSNDIVEGNPNYKRVVPYTSDETFISNRFSDSPTEWGMNDEGKYFLPPAEFGGVGYFPLAQSTWGAVSYWYRFPGNPGYWDNLASGSRIVRNAYLLSECLRLLVGKADPDIIFSGLSNCSRFLFGTNPLTNERLTPVIVPMTNITRGVYTEPQKESSTTLRAFLDMLKQAFKCYWYIDDSGSFHIEHISYFRNGFSYNADIKAVGIDLTELMNIRNGKPWAYGQNQYEFKKEEMPEEYNFSWADDSSDYFAGYPLKVISPYVQEGQVEEVTVGGFSADLDYILMRPNDMSEDNFILLSAPGSQTDYVRIPNSGNIAFNPQNGRFSWPYIVANFWIYDMPAYTLENGGINYTAKSVAKNKQQEVGFPSGNDDPDTEYLVKTGLGNGEFEELEVNLASRFANATLIYDTE